MRFPMRADSSSSRVPSEFKIGTLTEDIKRYPDELLKHRRQNDPFIFQDFEFKKQLGAGSFGSVYLAKELRSGKNVVIKTLSKASILEWNMIRQLQREIEIQCRLRHPNITRLYAYFHTDEHCMCI